MSGYVSVIGPRELVIDDSVGWSHANGGMTREKGHEPRDSARYPYGAHNAPFSLPLIPQSEWDDRIKEMEDTKTRLSDLIQNAGVKCKDQNGLPYCWIFAVVGAIEALRARQGLPYVELSAASAGSKITGFRSRGGMGMEGIEFTQEHGVVPTKLWPECKLNRDYDTAENWKEAEQFKLAQWQDVPDRDVAATMTCLLHRIPVAVGLNHWSHEIYYCDPVSLGNGKYGFRFRNSWSSSYGENGFSILTGSKMIPDDAEAPIAAAYDAE